MFYIIHTKFHRYDNIEDPLSINTEILLSYFCDTKDEYLQYCEDNKYIIIKNMALNFNDNYIYEFFVYNYHFENDGCYVWDTNGCGGNEVYYSDMIGKNDYESMYNVLFNYKLNMLLDTKFVTYKCPRTRGGYRNSGNIDNCDLYKIYHKDTPFSGDIRDPDILDMTKLGKLFIMTEL